MFSLAYRWAKPFTNLRQPNGRSLCPRIGCALCRNVQPLDKWL